MTPLLLVQMLFPETYKQQNHETIMHYYNDWKETELSLIQYKALLRTRG
mgnify:CR=1 FL=1